jgi:hypothetical protein
VIISGKNAKVMPDLFIRKFPGMEIDDENYLATKRIFRLLLAEPSKSTFVTQTVKICRRP